MDTPDSKKRSAHTCALNVGSDSHIENILVGGRTARALGVVIIVLFIGILLSFLVNVGVSAYLGTGDLADTYFDGNEHPGIVFSGFADNFYLSESIRQNIILIDYYLFGRLHTDDVLLGDDEFLFPIYDDEGDYNYVADYLGQAKPTESDLYAYCNSVAKITNIYADYGANCYFVIIPNSQTVYSDKMPDFLGDISENTRLNVVSKYLEDHGIKNFLNLTDHLIGAKENGELYNNTEDSLNSRGAYYAYLALIDMLPKRATENAPLISIKDGDLVRHTTVGKELARAAMLEHVIKNRTVSLSTDFVQKYQILLRYEEYDMAFPKIEYKSEFDHTPRVAFCFADEWDRIIMIDYLSNTFGTAVYRNDLAFNGAVIEKTNPKYIVFFLHEKDLGRLIDGSMLP
ncbi:MAG: hypothetical protein ACI3XI_07700 [Eubacteriales bacterium]